MNKIGSDAEISNSLSQKFPKDAIPANMLKDTEVKSEKIEKNAF